MAVCYFSLFACERERIEPHLFDHRQQAAFERVGEVGAQPMASMKQRSVSRISCGVRPFSTRINNAMIPFGYYGVAVGGSRPCRPPCVRVYPHARLAAVDQVLFRAVLRLAMAGSESLRPMR